MGETQVRGHKQAPLSFAFKPCLRSQPENLSLVLTEIHSSSAPEDVKVDFRLVNRDSLPVTSQPTLLWGHRSTNIRGKDKRDAGCL